MVRRGEIYDYDFGPTGDNRQEGKRPALIVQTDLLNQMPNYSLTIAVPLTTKGRNSPSYVRLEPSAHNGLNAVSYAKCEQIYTLTYDALGERRGSLSKEEMYGVNQALRLVLTLDK